MVRRDLGPWHAQTRVCDRLPWTAVEGPAATLNLEVLDRTQAGEQSDLIVR